MLVPTRLKFGNQLLLIPFGSLWSQPVFMRDGLGKLKCFIIRKDPATEGASSVKTHAYCSGQSGLRWSRN